MDFSIIERAGITQRQYADLVGVTRVTVNFWIKGRVRPRDIVRSRIALANAALERAVEAGELPITEEVQEDPIKATLARIKASLNTQES